MTPPNFQIEISSVEHPRLLAAVIDEARDREVAIGRVILGGGTRMVTSLELEAMLELAHSSGIDLYSFVSTRNSFEPLPDPHGGEQLRGEAAFADAVREVRHCAGIGLDGVLVADIGLLRVAGELSRAGELAGLRLKTSVSNAPLNASAALLYEELGATSINVSSSSTVDDMVDMRRVLSPATTLDVYVESPPELGGGLRYRELGALVDAAPVSLKFGLRNSPQLYPYGGHLEPLAEQVTREKVRRAELALAELAAQLAHDTTVRVRR